MPELTLFHSRGSCSSVTLAALIATGQHFDDVRLDLASNEHDLPAFRKISPFGKVPALTVGGALLTENVAILSWLDQTFPDVGLLPPSNDALEKAKQVAVLAWIASGWQPAARAMKRPSRWTTGDEGGVRERGRELMRPLVSQLNSTLECTEWYFGSRWSIADVYFHWAYTNAQLGSFDLSEFPAVIAHRTKVLELPCFKASVQRAMQSVSFRSYSGS